MPPRAHFTLAFMVPAPRRCDQEPRLARHGHGIENKSMRFEAEGKAEHGIEDRQPTELRRRREGGMPLRAHVKQIARGGKEGCRLAHTSS